MRKIYKRTRTTFSLILFILVSQSFVFQISAAQPMLKLWYKQPAINWMSSALPIGNGSLGGMFFGGVQSEQIQFNEKTLWTGSTTVRGAYQNFGNLFFDFPTQIKSTDYTRELSLDDAIGRVSYTSGNIAYLREYFASNPDSVIVMRISTPGNSGKLSFNIRLNDAHTGIKKIAGNQITISGKLDLISYEAQIVVINEGGLISTGSTQISVSNADAVTILLTAATNYNPQTTTYLTSTAAALHTQLNNRISTASGKSYSELKQAHMNDYQSLFGRVKFDLNTQMPNVTTDELVQSFKTHPYLDILFYQYGRYLMLGSSRGIQLPSNLQGIWNYNNSPEWQCDIHSNINVQMNYWPAENTNLSECHFPFMDYVANEALKVGGSWKNMATSLNCRGWALKTQNNIFGYSDYVWNRPSNAWYCTHLWQHYSYTLDRDFLEKKAFPVMKSACEFWFDRLTKDAAGKWEAPDEWSPEQGNWENGTAYSQQLIWELFTQTLKAAKILNADASFISQLSDKLANLDNGVKIGPWGEIREWKVQPDVQGNTHRHLSNLIGLYPGNQISYFVDSLNANAAKKTLISRGDSSTGWSRAWKIACWARLQDGEHAYKLIKAAQTLTYATTVNYDGIGGGIYENLLGSHPNYQIDMNFGVTAGITEMLLQSNLGFIYLLPALPNTWINGSYSGLKATNNFTVDLKWKNGLPLQAIILSGSGDTCKLYYPSIKLASIVDESGTIISFTQNKKGIKFLTLTGKKYTVNFDNASAILSDIIPYIKVDNNEKKQTPSVDIEAGQSILLSPVSSLEGTWLWTGPNNFTSTDREVSLSNTLSNQSGNYSVTQTVNGIKNICVFSVTIKAIQNILPDSLCFTPLYNFGNLIPDPYFNSPAGHEGWGTEVTNTDLKYVYCGSNSGKISGDLCSGSINIPIPLKPNTAYRMKAMILTLDGTFQLAIHGWNGSAGDLQKFINTNGIWQAIDFRFVTGSTVGGTQAIYFNNCDGSTGKTGYIDNMELYIEPGIQITTSEVFFNSTLKTTTFKVTGEGLSDIITITPPAGVKVSPTTLPMDASNELVTVSLTNSVPYSGEILLTSGNFTKKVDVTAIDQSSNCYIPLYSGVNLIQEPNINSLSSFVGWGSKSLNTDPAFAYCGNYSGKISGSGSCSGSFDAAITLKANTTYRERAMVLTVDGTFNLLVGKWNSSVSDVNNVVDTKGAWQAIDFTFSTGAAGGTTGTYFNSCGYTGKTGYIDNWELFEEVYTKVENLEIGQTVNIYLQNNQIVADLDLVQFADVQFSIFNPQGVLLNKEKTKIYSGKSHKVISRNLSSGVYLVQVAINGKVYMSKIIK